VGAAPLKAANTAADPTEACRARQELGKIKGVPQPELGNEREINFFVILREPKATEESLKMRCCAALSLTKNIG
jgi:hypothetical protein